MVTADRERLREITSRQNSQVKDLRRAAQHGEITLDGYCAIEGPHLIEEALRSGIRFKTVFFSSSSEGLVTRLLPQLSHQIETVLLPHEVFDSAVSTEAPQGVAALVRLPESSLADTTNTEHPLLIATLNVQDPGNMGTVLRSAEAFGASAVLTGENSVKVSNPKLMRASAGSVFRMKVIPFRRPDLDTLRNRGISILATSSHKGSLVYDIDFTQGAVVVIGNEGTGIPKDYVPFIDDFIRIPQSPRVESLNAGIAASVILYEAARQRAKA